MSVDVLRSLLLFFSEDDFIVASGDLVVILGYKGFPGSSVSKESTAMQETPAGFLGQEDPLEEGMTTYSSILAWRIPMDKGAWQATVHGVAKNQT